MSDVDLHAEGNCAAFSVCQCHIDLMRSLGVSLDTIAEMGRNTFAFGVLDAEPLAGGLYQPVEGSLPHVVMPVWENGDLVDLIAWHTSSPDDWSLRTGNGWALGFERLLKGSLHIAATPLDWLRCGGQALCILDWAAAEVDQLAELDALTVSDAATDTLLRHVFNRPVRLPNIKVLEVARAA